MTMISSIRTNEMNDRDTDEADDYDPGEAPIFGAFKNGR
jgi:hypothetical protein